MGQVLWAADWLGHHGVAPVRHGRLRHPQVRWRHPLQPARERGRADGVQLRRNTTLHVHYTHTARALPARVHRPCRSTAQVGVATATMPLAGGFVGIIPALQLLEPPLRLTVGEQACNRACNHMPSSLPPYAVAGVAVTLYISVPSTAASLVTPFTPLGRAARVVRRTHLLRDLLRGASTQTDHPRRAGQSVVSSK